MTVIMSISQHMLKENWNGNLLAHVFHGRKFSFFLKRVRFLTRHTTYLEFPRIGVGVEYSRVYPTDLKIGATLRKIPILRGDF